MHPDLAALLRRRKETIADHGFRDRDPAAHLEALKAVSLEITAWHEARRGTLPICFTSLVDPAGAVEVARWVREQVALWRAPSAR